MDINSKEMKISNLHTLMTNNENKENDPNVLPKYTKLETDMTNYETLVIQLNKLSAEEQNVRNKLFAHNWKVCYITYLCDLNLCMFIFEFLGRSCIM